MHFPERIKAFAEIDTAHAGVVRVSCQHFISEPELN